MGSLILIALMAAGVTVVIPSFASAEGNGSPDECQTGITGTGTEDSMSFTADEGDMIEGVCIKSGSNMFDGNQHSGVLGNGLADDCYMVEGVGTDEVTVTREGDGPECQGISHIDIVLAEGEPEPEGATVTVVKQGLLAGATANFSTDLGANFSLSFGDTTEVFSNVAAGSHTVTEAALAGYTLTGASCTGDTGTDTLVGGALTFTVAAGADVTCTFINAPAQVAQHTVTTVKYLDGARAAEGSFDILFTWTADNFNGGLEDSTTIALASGNGWQHVSGAMDAGADFSVEEQGIDGTCEPNDTYRLLGYGIGATLDEADNGVDSATIGALTNIQANQFIVVFNESCPTAAGEFDVTIRKYVDGVAAVEGDGSFEFTANWTEPGEPAGSGNFTLEAANSFSATTSPLTAGSMYSIVENEIDATCDPGDEYRLAGFGIGADLAAALAATPSMTASIANLQADAFIVVRNVSCAAPLDFDVTIRKYVDGVAAVEADGSFDFTANWDEPDAAPGSGDFTLEAANNFSATTSPLTAGSMYSIVENDIDATCDPGDEYRLAGFGIGADLAAALAATPVATASINDLQADAFIVVRNVSCATVGSITIVKNWVGATGVATNFTASANLGATGNAFMLDAADTDVTFSSLANGVFTITETAMANWALTGATCTGTLTTESLVGNVLTVNLLGGESVTCTFTNTFTPTAPGLGTITIVKNWGGADGVATSFTASANLGAAGNAFTLNDDVPGNEDVMFSNLGGGTFTITESSLAGWTLTGATCTGATASTAAFAASTLTVNLAADDDLICTFTNTLNTAVSPTFPPDTTFIPPVNVVVPPVNVIVPPVTNIPPSVTIPPSVVIPPSIVETAPPPSAVLDSPPPVLSGVGGTSITNGGAVGGVTPLAPSTGNTSGERPGSQQALLFAGLAIAAGALAMVGFGVTRRR